MRKTILAKLNRFQTEAAGKTKTQLGYPLNLSADYTELFKEFDFSLLLNNIGDPVTTYSASNRFIFEKEVLEYFADLYLLDHRKMRGYVTSGGSEGNLYGLYLGRENYPEGTLLFSETSHYSIPKYAKMLRLPHKTIKSQTNGEIDYHNFEKNIVKLSNKPLIINLNIGTTMSGAIDSIDNIWQILKKHKIQNYYIHCDAALFGAMIPFIHIKNPVNFTQNIGSLSISGHKFLGTPTPCGVVLTRNEYVAKVNSIPGYTGSEDTTILGSRSGHAPIFLWYAIKSRNKATIKKTVNDCIQLAEYLNSRLDELKLTPILNHDSNIVMFDKPSDSIVAKWKLAVEKNKAHVVVMPHVSKEMLDQFINDLNKSNNSKI